MSQTHAQYVAGLTGYYSEGIHLSPEAGIARLQTGQQLHVEHQNGDVYYCKLIALHTTFLTLECDNENITIKHENILDIIEDEDSAEYCIILK